MCRHRQTLILQSLGLTLALGAWSEPRGSARRLSGRADDFDPNIFSIARVPRTMAIVFVQSA
jgi:hypothetical protein